MHRSMPGSPPTVKITSYQTPATEMEPAIWSRLPDHLLERILALLPLKSLLNLRSTCKHFNSLLFSPSFLSLTNANTNTNTNNNTSNNNNNNNNNTCSLSSLTACSFLLLSHPHSQPLFPLYNVSLDRWRTLAIPLTCTSPPLSQSQTPHLVSTSNGLLCFSLPTCFYLFNLLTKSSKFINFPNCPFTSTTLVPSSPPSSPLHGYKIFVLSASTTINSSPNKAFVYDSASQSWANFDGLNAAFTDNSQQEGAYFDGSVYFMTREPFSVVGFNLETGRWDVPVSAPMLTELVFARLVGASYGGRPRLFMVGGVGRDGISRNLRIWEMFGDDDGGHRSIWTEVASLPELMCRKFGSVCYHNYDHVYCIWHEGMVCVCCYTWPEILVYKVMRRTWHWLPRCPYLPERWSCGFRWFSFSPDFYALV